MLEHVPAWLGSALRNVRAGHANLIIADTGIAVPEARLDLGSPAFGDRGRLPDRFTADGGGVSPPLIWDTPPTGTKMLALVVEDPDAPAPHPLIHAILWGIDPTERSLAEGALAGTDAGSASIGRNSYLASGWLPPDPPTGHGEHDYVFQLYALGEAPDLGAHPGRGAVIDALRAIPVLAVGVLVGTYSRDMAPSASGRRRPSADSAEVG
ncbi:YbhB/YbcL family Raf kinase inhibitor-like protein [Novosphingobium sp. P6W]|uniref:YbhB/YbcL family Raf kinase inhibitor-like protein n=1 Tax=Novosphingobium sp. P6W TaxID=1609758 RepID=UPI0005C4E8E9|nr:YbhB/YbcL family Raf kinase inhibitor-like protein [Novosphingobium sp. P6W]AXB79016.1 YbhB/YbcL family Raf kinase inhibitor-like protein [Novosphingobium sp. P6W]